MSIAARNAALVLKLIRDSGQITVGGLLHSLGFRVDEGQQPPPLMYKHSSHLEITLDGLVHLELVEVTVASGERIAKEHHSKYSPDTVLKATKKLFDLQKVLNLSLTELALTPPKSEIKVIPVFGEPANISPKDVFVLMPFVNAMKAIYTDHIKKVVERIGLTCGRADDLFGPREIMRDIWSSIFNAKFIIADCSGRNANVFYEMGIAHTLGKDVILITQDKSKIPFDIGYRRYFKYEYTPQGVVRLEENLDKALRELTSG